MKGGSFVDAMGSIKIPPICVGEELELRDGSISAVFDLEGKRDEFGRIVRISDSVELDGELDGVLRDGEEDGRIAGIRGFATLFERGVESLRREFQCGSGEEDGGRVFELEGEMDGGECEGAGASGRYAEGDAS